MTIFFKIRSKKLVNDANGAASAKWKHRNAVIRWLSLASVFYDICSYMRCLLSSGFGSEILFGNLKCFLHGDAATWAIVGLSIMEQLYYSQAAVMWYDRYTNFFKD